MIKEIEDPIETIQEYLAKKRISKKIKKQFNTNLSEYDVYFKEDTSLIEEFAKKCNIDYELANKIAVIFFEEIKKGMLNGCVVQIHYFGKFFINGIHFNKKGKLVLPDKDSHFYPKFKAGTIFKRYILNQNKE